MFYRNDRRTSLGRWPDVCHVGHLLNCIYIELDVQLIIRDLCDIFEVSFVVCRTTLSREFVRINDGNELFSPARFFYKPYYNRTIETNCQIYRILEIFFIHIFRYFLSLLLILFFICYIILYYFAHTLNRELYLKLPSQILNVLFSDLRS